MEELAGYHGVWAERQRRIAWAEEHAWMDAEVRHERARERRATVARVLRALAVLLAPADAKQTVEHGPPATEPRS